MTSDELMMVREVAAWLRVHPCKIYRLVKAGEIRSLRTYYRIYIPRSAVDAYLEANRVLPSEVSHAR